ncbi:hypothetical protein AAFF_G00200390 [Aldrovandia affinis]|uniref:Solute carrier family 25 member 45 n=1 Tax=Aldrovandia affinis TaxID=143900 RepID=A0AAD7RI99_9TELE|nr:hypothetical protein AAFF_G00200390 [Aldrovandia affinis]
MPLVEFVAGWISGAVGLVVGHPMDTVKVRLQTQTRYKGIFDCVARTYSLEGMPGFFKGMAFPVLSIAFSNSVVFGSYSNALDYLTQYTDRSKDEPASAAAVFAAGCFSGVAQVLVTAPVDLVKVRLQNQTKGRRGVGGDRYRGPVHCVAVILKEDGARGLFRGMWALALRDVPCYGLYFLPYELIRNTLTREWETARHLCSVDGGWRGGRGNVGLCHTHGCGEGPSADVRNRGASVQGGPALHHCEHAAGGGPCRSCITVTHLVADPCWNCISCSVTLQAHGCRSWSFP